MLWTIAYKSRKILSNYLRERPHDKSLGHSKCPLQRKHWCSECSGGSKGGGDPGPKFSQFHAVFWKFWQNRMLESLEGWPPSYWKSWTRPWNEYNGFIIVFRQNDASHDVWKGVPDPFMLASTLTLTLGVCDLNCSVRGRVSSSRTSFWTPLNLNSECRTPPT